MRTLLWSALLLALPSCIAPEDGAPLDDDTHDALLRAPVLAQAGDRALVALPIEPGPTGTDVRLPRVMAVRQNGAVTAPAVPVVAGALLDRGPAWVTTDGALLCDDVELDRGVLPELAARGSLLAWARGPGDGAGVYVFDGARTRKVSGPLAFADRPLFIDDDTLVIVGAMPSGVAGVWIGRVDGSAPIPVTNAGLRTGKPWGRAFVPPPAYHESMRIDGKVLTYDDGAQTRSVVLP